ncbi:MAG: type I glyceraldehyde-3-phosphate dehydrogenase [Planctomycetia bacterium]|nr:type I glyceraldehyde-3-phosphate dehydrogenase [Planctomycetia bacterium]MBL6913752.1 type I glyceraldehyde-3-phosphate dehydrogenase [Planctomycetota bacterium]HCW44140.1 type I glyceraldehyde-3-phosphate dehydrogenase [Planctomycetota bacterium]
MKIAINGFGRIGRSVFRILAERDDLKVVAINDISDPKSLAYLLKYDSVMGPFSGSVTLENGVLTTDKQDCRMLAERDPASLPWKDLGVDVVIESTGRFRSRAECQLHIDAGAEKVILTVPPKDDIDALLVLGVNDDILKPSHRIVSNASCTTNCLAPLAKVLNDSFGLIRGVMTTVHAYTNDQSLSDWYHKDLRRSRAAGENTIPTSTGAARAVGKVLPELEGKLDGMAMRVPVIDGSVVDLVATFEKSVTTQDINEAIATAASGPLSGILEYCTDPIVSSDIIGNPHSSIFDSQLTQAVGTHSAKVLSWYDNEWGYSNRVVDLIDRVKS